MVPSQHVGGHGGGEQQDQCAGYSGQDAVFKTDRHILVFPDHTGVIFQRGVLGPCQPVQADVRMGLDGI